MRTFLHLLYKDFLLLIRDKAGLLLLFLMPLALVLIMTSMQDGMMSVVTNTDISLIILNDDRDSIGNTMENELKKSTIFNTQLAKDIDASMNEQGLKEVVAKGEYLVGIYIPKNTTKRFSDSFAYNLETETASKDLIKNDSLFIRVYLDPTMKPSVHSTLMSNIREFCMGIQIKYSLKEVSKLLEEIAGTQIDLSKSKGINIDEQIAYKAGQESLRPNAVQHNVPAWTLFAIFFIVIPLAGNIIKEREDGSFNRLMTMPCTFAQYLSSKMFLYLLVCISQFLMVLAMGIWVFPLINLDAFAMHGYFFRLLFVVICAAAAAIGFGTAISAMATSQPQASVFGAISVVILSAIGGIWVPTFAMPEFLRALSNISPLNWSIDAFYSIILRKSTIIEILPECMYLLIFAFICFGIAIFYKKYKKQ